MKCLHDLIVYEPSGTNLHKQTILLACKCLKSSGQSSQLMIGARMVAEFLSTISLGFAYDEELLFEATTALISAQNTDIVFIQSLANQFELHQALVIILREFTSPNLLSEVFKLTALICASTCSSHVVKFISLGIVELIKCRLQRYNSQEEESVFINAAFALANIAADSDFTAHQAILVQRVYQAAVVPLLMQDHIPEIFRIELIMSLGNFFLHADFDLTYYLLTDSEILPCLIKQLTIATTPAILFSLIQVKTILGKAKKFRVKAQQFGLMTKKSDDLLLMFEAAGGIDKLELL